MATLEVDGPADVATLEVFGPADVAAVRGRAESSDATVGCEAKGLAVKLITNGLG